MDLRTNGLLSIDNSQEIDRIEIDVIEEYNSFIGKFIKINSLSDTSLFLTASCRNTIVSKTHDIFCRIALLENSLKQGKCPDKIEVDNKFVASAINQVLAVHNCNDVKVNYQRSNILILILLNIVKIIYIAFNSWLWTRFNLKVRPKDKVLLLDTFLFKDSFDSSGYYHDRYYNNHETYLDKHHQSKIFFAPTLYGLKHPWDYISLFKQIKLSDRNFLIKESWLKLSDYLFAIFNSIIIPLRIKKYPNFRGIDVSQILRKEVLSDVASPSLFRALCQYRFIKRLSKENVQICGAVNWFENSVNDRALNLSFRSYYPKTNVRGYQGFMPIRYYASLQPQSYELLAGVLPNELYVINEETRLLYKKTCKDLPLKLSPAFRFSYLFDLKDKRSHSDKMVLISLPGAGMDAESIGIIRNYLFIADSLDSNVRVMVKVHPTRKIKQLIKLASEFSDQRLEYTNKGIPELLESANVLISSGSSVCVEAVSAGIPVAIYGSRSGITMNPIQSTVPNSNWCVFYSEQQLKTFLKVAFSKDDRISIVNKLFTPINRENAMELFKCI
jgi:hypothetical protein